MNNSSVLKIKEGLSDNGYIATEGLASAVFLAMELNMPLFLEGEAGVGKTELAKTLSAWLNLDLIRLQCYEGIDASQAVYEWDYPRQLLMLRVNESQNADSDGTDDARKNIHDIYSEEFLIRRPLLKAISGESQKVLLIDELDRSDDEFEALLMEVLSDWSVTIPEMGTIRAKEPPLVVITSNRTRDVHDALKRRCIYHWIEHPDTEREVEIIRLKAEGVSQKLAEQVAALSAKFRDMDLHKPPGVAESIVWAAALARLGRKELSQEAVEMTLGAILKYSEDQNRVLSMGDLVQTG